MVEKAAMREEDIDVMHAMDVRQGPTCKECGAKLELQGGQYSISLRPNAPSPGTRFWRCPGCNRSIHEPIEYDHVNDKLLVNLGGE